MTTSSVAKGYGLFKKSISLFIFLFIFLNASIAASGEGFQLNDLLRKAEEKKLSTDRHWEVLLHYKPAGKGFKSLIDDPRFFLSPEGKTDPQAELEATIKALFQSNEKNDAHPKCRFIARYAWLREELNIDESQFSDISCAEFNNMMNNTIRPKSVALVFPAAYMNNPASMFGHTLLRIDGIYQSKLLSYAANYAAYVDDDMGFFYMFKGIFGYYKGYFKIFPYYERIKEYNDTEQRDMWEYSLNFSEEEVIRIFKHLWELKDIYSDYYFFDENCSYNLLFLLEAARPSLRLTDRTGLWVIPVDTIRVIKESGIIENIEFRPAKATKIRHIASLLNDDYQKKALQMAFRKINSDLLIDAEDEEKTKIFDLAIETIQYRYNNKEIDKDEYLKLFLPMLRERSKLGKPDESSYNIPVPVSPEAGHLSGRFSLGMGMQDDAVFQELRLRPAYHGFADPDDGYREGSQIIFVDTAVRYYTTTNRIKLHALDLIDIISLSPRADFFKPFSWKVKTGLIQKTYQDNNDYLIYQLNSGAGLAYKNEIIGLWYALSEANLNIGGKFKNNYAAGIGMEIGTVKQIADYWKIHLSAEVLFYGIKEWFEEKKASMVQTLRLNQNNSLNLSVSWLEIFNNERTEVKLNWNYYF